MKKLVLALTVSLSSAFIATSVMADPGPYSPKCADTNGGVFSACETATSRNIYQAINKVFTDRGLASPGFTDNEGTDSLQVTTPNEFWTQLSPDDSSEFAFISITAANVNQLGVFPALGDASTDSTFFNLSFTGGAFTGSGSMGDPYPGFVNPLSDQDFGFSLRSVGANSTEIWSSDVSENSDGIDHMLAFQLDALAKEEIYVRIDGNNDGDLDDPEDILTKIELTEETFLIAWEDKPESVNDGDYNDAIFLVTRIEPTEVVVPEPMSMVLFGGGIAGLVANRRKKKLS